MDGPTHVVARATGKKLKNKKQKSKHHVMDTLKEEDGARTPVRKLSKNERRAKEEEGTKAKKFYLNVTYKQYQKYMKLLKEEGEDVLREEISKDHEELLRKYGAYIDSESEVDEEDDAYTTTTSTEFFITTGNTTSAQTTTWEYLKKGGGFKPEMKSTPRYYAPLREYNLAPVLMANVKYDNVAPVMRCDLILPKIGHVVKPAPSAAKSPRGGRGAPGLLPKRSTLSPHSSEKKFDESGLPLVKGNKDLMEALLSDSRAMLAKSRTTLSDNKDSFHAHSTSESGRASRAPSRGSRRGFPNLTDASSNSMSNKKRRPSVTVIAEPDWETRKLSLHRSSTEWLVVRDHKYPKEVERVKALEASKKIGEKLRKQDVPITCQRWKYVPLEPIPLRFGVTYTGVQAKKVKSVYRKKPGKRLGARMKKS